MSTYFENYNALVAKARRLHNKLDRLTDQATHPINFALPGEVRWSSNIGWTSDTTWGYAPRWVKAELLARQERAEKKIMTLKAKRERALAKAKEMFKKMTAWERGMLIIVGGDPAE